MKISLFLLVILSASFGFPAENSRSKAAEEKLDACTENCSEQDLKLKYVCTGNGSGFTTRCYFNCYGPLLHQKEVECKRGTKFYCWNSECPPEEKVYKENETLCHTDYEKSEHETFFGSVCELKCDSGNYKKDAVYVSCHSAHLEYLSKLEKDK